MDQGPNSEPRERRWCAARRSNGEPCRKPPIKGGTVCSTHGGSAVQVKRRAAERVAVERAERAVDRLGLRRTGLTAAELLQETVERAGADLEYLAGKAAGGDAAYVDAYLLVLDRASRIAKASLDAGVQEKLASLDAARVALSADALVSVLDRALVAAGLDAGQVAAVRREVGMALVEVAG